MGSGGAIYNYANNAESRIENIDGLFKGNNASARGGAIYNENGSIGMIKATFDSNKANSGGAIANMGDYSGRGHIDSLSGTFINNSATNYGGAIYNTGNTSEINIVSDDRETVFSNNVAAGSYNAIHNTSSAIINLEAGNYDIIFNDTISGDNSGTININEKATGTVQFNDTMDYNTFNLYAGELQLNQFEHDDGFISWGNFGNSAEFNARGGSVNLANNIIQNAGFGSLSLYSNLDMQIDVNLADKKADTITVSNFGNTGNYSINISNLNILSQSTEKAFSIALFGDDTTKEKAAQSVLYTGNKTVVTPIYTYQVVYNPETGNLDFSVNTEDDNSDVNTDNTSASNTSNFNPAVLAAPIAAQLGGYLVQINSYDEAFRNMDMYELSYNHDKNEAYYNGFRVWAHPYALSETVNLHHGPNVRNNIYGTYAGIESQMYGLGNGWSGIYGAYIGYNGSYQEYSDNRIYQNGGTFGIIGMAYKNGFYTGLTANTSISDGHAKTMYGRENFTAYMAGMALKSGYNYEMANGRYVIQPHALLSYSVVDLQNYSNAGNVSIHSNALKAIQIEPGIKFIVNYEDGWQPYATVSGVWSYYDDEHFKANDINLPDISVNPYVKGVLGIRKSREEKYIGYAQAFGTAGGRNGVGMHLGFRFNF